MPLANEVLCAQPKHSNSTKACLSFDAVGERVRGPGKATPRAESRRGLSEAFSPGRKAWPSLLQGYVLEKALPGVLAVSLTHPLTHSVTDPLSHALKFSGCCVF